MTRTDSERMMMIMAVIGPQMKKSYRVKVDISGQSYEIDYYLLRTDQLSPKGLIVLAPGFGSGWTGIAKLGCDLSLSGYDVYMVSLLGYGNSDDPKEFYYQGHYFSWEATAISRFIETITSDKVHLVGHSMAAAIMAELAAVGHRQVASLTLLNPAGFEKRGRLELALKFLANGIDHAMAFRGDLIWKELRKFLPKERSPFSFSRFSQRLHEWRRICEGESLNSLLAALLRCIPVCSIWGSKDYVYPKSKSSIYNIDKWYRNNLQCIELPLWHNSTMWNSEMAAEAIDEFIKSNTVLRRG